MRKTYGDLYDYETEYQKQITNLQEFEYRRLLKDKKVPYLYLTKTIKSGKIVEVEIYPVFQKKKGMPGKRKKKTGRAQRDLNDKNARKYFVRLVNTNFSTGDYICTFTYRNNPKTIEEAEKHIGNYIKRLIYRRKKMGIPKMKYIYITEMSPKGRVHHHVIMDNLLDRDTVEDCWKLGNRNSVRRLAEDDFGLTGIATYLSKDPKGRKRWKGSRNLKKPTVTTSATKFKRGRVIKMARNKNLIEQELKKEYPKLKYLDAEVKTNDINSMFYIYARMVRQE